MITRYEYNNIGIFEALDYLYEADMDMDDYKELGDIEDVFDKKLPTMPFISVDTIYKFYFTEYGTKRFKNCLDRLVELFNTYCDANKVNIISIEYPINEDLIVYRDKFQIVVKN